MILNTNDFPNNKKYIQGECYITWNRRNSIVSNFVIENCEIHDSLIIEAKPSSNTLVLIDGSEMTKISFTVRPTVNDKRKEYGISSTYGDNGINIGIIDFSQDESNVEIEKSPFADNDVKSTPVKKQKPKLKRVEV